MSSFIGSCLLSIPKQKLIISFVLLFIAVSAGLPSLATDTADNLRLAQFEQTFFSHTFSNETFERRVSRLEGVVYGQSQKGSTSLRATRLLQVLDKQYAPVKLAKVAHSKTPDATDYPTVSAMEQTVFRQSFSSESIGQRLSRLEMQAFHATSPRLAYVDRVDRLLERYPNALRMAQSAQRQRERQSASTSLSRPSIIPVTSGEVPSVIRNLPPIQPPSYIPTLASGKRHPRRIMLAQRKTIEDQQIQFGMGVSQTQAQRYSPEMMKMLPPQVRSQMSGTELPPENTSQRVPIARPNPIIGPAHLAPVHPTPSAGFLGVPLN